VSNDLVVQLGAKLDQFQSDMNSAGDMADSAVSRIESSFAGLNPSAGGFAALFTGASAGIAGIIAYVVSLNKELADMQTTASQVGLTLKDFQGVQFGGQVAGLSTDQINTGLEKSAALLNDASRNSNTLSKELEANGLSVKNANGQLITQNQLLATAAGLVSNAANPQDAIKVAEMLGFTKEWVPLLQQGAAAMGTLGDQATSAGAIIDDATIKKASDFNAAWQKSSVEFATYMKAAITDLLPAMDDLIARGAKFLQSIKDKGGGVQGIVGSLGPALTVGEGDNKKVVSIDTAGLNQALENFKTASVFSEQYWASLGAIFGASIKLTPIALAGAGADAMNSSGYPSSGPTSIGEVRANLADPTQKNALDTAADGPHTKIPAKDTGGADPVQAAINSLQKHTLATQADADAVGLGAGALAGFKADAEETAAVLKSGKAETDAQSDAFGDLKDKAIAAADALAKANVASTISRGAQTAFFTPEDLTIANQLKGIYGDNIPAAMASAEAASLRFNSTITQLGQLGQQVNSGFLVDFETQIRNGATAMQALQTAGVNALGAIADKLTKMAADNLWSSAFGGSSSGAGGFLSSLFKIGGTSTPNTAAMNTSNATLANGTGGAFYGPAFGGVTAAVGGLIRGPGSSTSDSIPARLSDGEYVINAKAASQYKDVLDSINSGRGYANGGPVGNIVPNDIMPSGGGGGITVHTGSPITVQGSADQTTLLLMQQALAKRDAELPSKVVQAVTMAQKQRRLR
jgi:hypothetical protein